MDLALHFLWAFALVGFDCASCCGSVVGFVRKGFVWLCCLYVLLGLLFLGSDLGVLLACARFVYELVGLGLMTTHLVLRVVGCLVFCVWLAWFGYFG